MRVQHLYSLDLGRLKFVMSVLIMPGAIYALYKKYIDAKTEYLPQQQ